MTPREVKLARRVAVDYMVIGIAIGGAGKWLGERLQPNEMLTSVGKKLMEAALKQDRQSFADTLAVRHQFQLGENERIGDGLIRLIKESNVDQTAHAIADQMAEQLTTFVDLDDAIETLERCVSALHDARAKKESIS